MIQRIVAVIVMAALAGCLVFAGWKAVLMASEGGALGVLLALAVVVFLGLGVTVIVREWRYGRRSAAMARAWRGGLMTDTGRALMAADIDFDGPSLRAQRRAVVDRLMPAAVAAAEAADAGVRSESPAWVAWYEIAVLHDASGRRRPARDAMAQAMARYSATGAPTSAMQRDPGSPEPVESHS